MTFLILMFFGTFAIGFSDVLRRKYLLTGIPENVFLTLSLLGTASILCVVIFITGIPDIEKGFLTAFVSTVFLNLISQYLIIKAFKLSEVSLIAPLRLIIPPLVIASGFLVLKEVPSLLGVVGIALTVIGFWIFFLIEYNTSTGEIMRRIFLDKGARYGLCSSILFAASFPFDKKIVVTSSALFSVAATLSALGLIFLLLFTLFDRSFIKNCVRTLKTFPMPILYISAWSAFGTTLTFQALNYSLAAYASSLKRLQVLWTIILAGRFLKEKNAKRRFFASIIILSGIMLSVFA